jgi:phage shock protein PspC (stress-responsive transcriptional regulator)
MKKNISINISGIIFHIEEDGYESLRKYLDSINKYFSSFEDSSEILADIESRIAEIFLSKLSEGKQVITAEDVNGLITTMGSVSDFKAAEEQPEFVPSEESQDHSFKTENTQSTADAESSASSSSSSSSSNSGPYAYIKPKQLFRDQKRKVLGGVCAGLGTYFNVDPVWIRLLFVILSGVTLLVYLIMWIFVPGSYDLEEPQVEKKMYRDGNTKVIGGVSGGVAAFLGIDIVAVRILFVVFAIIPGAIGLIAYIVLWIVLPEAKTLTDRMQMQGEPVTLSNIETNIKRNLNVDDRKEESAFTKIILFPFRVIGLILTGLARALGPVIEVVRVIIGVLIVMFGVSLVFGAVVAGGVLLGLMTSTSFAWADMMSFPIREFTETFPGWIGFAGFVAALIPGIFIILLGSSVIAKKMVFGAAAGWTLFILFFVSIALLSVGIPRIVYANKEDGTYKVVTTYNLNGKKAVLKLNEVGMDDYSAASLYLKGYDGKEIKFEQAFSAQGNTRQKAIENAKMATYNLVVDDSVFTFDSNISFKENLSFHFQHMNGTLYIPYDMPFVLTEEFSRSNFLRDNIDWDYVDGHLWRMTPKGLDCLSCPVANGDPETQDAEEEEMSEVQAFDEIELHGAFDVEVRRGDDYKVSFEGSDKIRNLYEFKNEGDRLVVDYNGRMIENLFEIGKIKIEVTLPNLKKIRAHGEGKIELRDFESENLTISLSGPVKLSGRGRATNIDINLSAKADMDLEGDAENMEASIDGGSHLDAFSFEVNHANVEVYGTSTAKVNATETLEMPEKSVNMIKYKGHPRVKKWN